MGGTVLVGEDDQGVQSVLSELLTSAGYEVVLAGDGRELKRCVEEGLRPSVILLDLTMPGADGYDFLAWRASSPLARQLPVVVYSASDFNALLLRTFKVSAVLGKPADTDELLKALSDAAASE
jgi:two-component system chemotaxis response regulator CheY